MDISDYVTIEDVRSACHDLGIGDWTGRTDTRVAPDEAEAIRQAVGAEALKVSLEAFQQGLEVELEHGMQYPDANVTNNHPILTGRVVLAHLKEMLDYYARLEVAELEGDLFKASRAGDAAKLARLYPRWLQARAKLSSWETSGA
jgi:hypothetical protein